MQVRLRRLRYFWQKTHQNLLLDGGVRNADSVTIDFSQSAVSTTFFRSISNGRQTAFQIYFSLCNYLNPVESKDEYLIWLSNLSRLPDVLMRSSCGFTLKVTGKEAIGSFLEEVHYRAKDTYHLLKQKNEVIHEPALSTVVFHISFRDWRWFFAECIESEYQKIFVWDPAKRLLPVQSERENLSENLLCSIPQRR